MFRFQLPVHNDDYNIRTEDGLEMFKTILAKFWSDQKLVVEFNASACPFK